MRVTKAVRTYRAKILESREHKGKVDILALFYQGKFHTWAKFKKPGRKSLLEAKKLNRYLRSQ